MHEIYDLGLILKTLRTRDGLSQQELGRKINRDKGIISRYESNLQTPSFEIMRDLSRIFNVSMDYLAGFEMPGSVSTFGLTDEQTAVISDLSDIFRSRNSAVTADASAEYNMLGRICACLVKKC